MDSISIASVTIDTYQTGKNNRLSAFSFPCDSLFPPFYRLLYFGKFKTTNPYLTSSSCPPLMIQQWGTVYVTSSSQEVSFNLAYNKEAYIAIPSDNDYGRDRLAIKPTSNVKFVIYGETYEGYKSYAFWFSLGR